MSETAKPTGSTGPWYESHRSTLMALCYRLLGSVVDAEDAVQETFLKVSQVDPGALDNPRAYVMRVATHWCLDQMKAARAKREVYPGTWLPEPVFDGQLGVQGPAEYACDVSYGLMLTLERLTPAERAAFVLHDVFDAGYAELATALDRNEAACRQLVTRAREHLRDLKGRFTPTGEQVQRVFGAFAEATRTGNVSLIEEVLCGDAILFSDGGGKAKSALQPICGSNRIARFFVGIASKWPMLPPVDIVQCLVNGLPGVVIRHAGEPYPTVLCFEWRQDGVSRVYSVRNPDKTRRATVGPEKRLPG